MILLGIGCIAVAAFALALLAYGGAADAVRHADAVWGEVRQLRERVRRLQAEVRGGGGDDATGG